MATIFLDNTDDMAPLWAKALTTSDPEIAINLCPGQPGDIPALLAGYDTCIVDHSYFDAETLRRCAGLKHIVFLGTGASSFIDVEAAQGCGIAVHTIKGYGDTTVAEHTMALVMAAARSVARMDREVRAGQWRQIEGVQLLGKTLGIIGMGGIGREVARMATGLGMRVLAWNRTAKPGAEASLEAVLGESDVVCLCLALNDGTRGFIDAEKIGRMKAGAIFINTARADIVDTAALAAAVKGGRIRHAAVDVFTPEPPLPDNPLLGLENVTITAHAGFMTPEATETMLRKAIDIVIATRG